MTARAHMDRKLRTKRALYRQRAAAVEPVFGQMKDRQEAGHFSMRGLERCRGEWQLDAFVHNLRKLHRDSVRRSENRRNGRRTASLPAISALRCRLALAGAQFGHRLLEGSFIDRSMPRARHRIGSDIGSGRP